MISIFVQLFVAGLVVVAAGLKSLQFAQSDLTDFELERRRSSGDKRAELQANLRAERPLLDALRRTAVLLLTIIIVIVLGSVYSFWLAVVWAFGWLVVIELLSSRVFVTQMAEKLSAKYQPQILKAVRSLAPVLRVLADSRALGVSHSAVFYSKGELQQEVQRDTTVLSPEEKLLIRQALAYQDMRVADIMTPRSVVVTVGADETLGPLLLDRLHKSGHSRFPVVHGSLDHVQGVLYVHNLVPLDPKLKKVEDSMDPRVFYVHQDQSLEHVLKAFLRTKHHLFVVVNEFEEAVGVVSIEDVLETIIGRKIVDEFDQYEDLRAVAKLAAGKRRKENSHLS